MAPRYFKNVMFCVVVGAISPLSVAADTLKDALRGAYQHSGLLQKNRALLRAADEDVAQAVAALRPVLSWTANAGYSSARTSDHVQISASLNASMLMYDFGRSDLGIARLKEVVLATRAGLMSIEQDVLYNAANAYFELRRAEETVALRQSNVRLIERELQAARDRFDVGEVTRTDVSLAEARLASARAALAGANGALAQSKAVYLQAVGKKPGRTAAPGRLPSIPSSVDRAIAVARVNNPLMQQTQHSIAAAELAVQSARLSAKPTVNLSAGLTGNDFSGDGTGLDGTFGVTASGPIYQGGQLRSVTRKLEATRDAARADVHLNRHEIDRRVQFAYAALDIARSSRVASNQQIRAANVAFEGVREEATLGARTTLDVLNAEQELLDAKSAGISAVIDEHIAAFAVLSAIGKLTVKDLGLGIKTYDPAEYYNLVKSAPLSTSPQGTALDRILKKVAGH